jgi:hypothetical protein
MQQYYIIKYSSTSKNSLAFESINLLPEDKSTYTPRGITGEVAFWCKDNNGQRYYLKPLNDLPRNKVVYYHTSNIQISGINELVMSPIYKWILNSKQRRVASKVILVCDSDGLLYTASKELESYSHIDNPEVLEKIQLKNNEKINLIEAKIAVLKNLLNIL